MTTTIIPTNNLAETMPNGYYEVVGFRANNKNVTYGKDIKSLEHIENIKNLQENITHNPALCSHWENAETQKYYPYSFSIIWEKNGTDLCWHIYMNHTGNTNTGHPAFRTYFATQGKLEGCKLVDMSLVPGSDNPLFLETEVAGVKYSNKDITDRTAKPKHVGTYSKSVQWTKLDETYKGAALYQFLEINTPEEDAEIQSKIEAGEEPTPKGFGCIRNLLVGNSRHGQIGYIVRQIDEDFFKESIRPGQTKVQKTQA